MIRPSLALALLVVAPGVTRAQLRSGPEPGSGPAALPAFAVPGPHAGGQADLAADRAGKPTVYLFVRADRLDRPMGRFMKTLDEALARGVEGTPEAASVAIWITEDPGASKEYLPRLQQSLKFEKTRLSVFEGGPLGPDGWQLNDSAGLTAVVVRDGKVVFSRGYESLGDSDVRPVVQALRDGAEGG